MRKLVFILSAISVVMICSCDGNRVFDQSYSIPGQLWHQDSTYVFEIEINDTLNLHSFYLNLRHNTDYQYSNIFFFMKSSFPNGNKASDTIECILADPGGKWLGDGFGKIRDNSILLKDKIRFPLKGIYIFQIQQGMRVENLAGIEDIGVRIEKQ